ncbi:MAG: ABC transporter substrate-binding protein [Wenzhouxiangellaceae bacterium]|nr:ABC transporter substrate-binding protein [Wenzhouxiangellaceae bacterium]
MNAPNPLGTGRGPVLWLVAVAWLALAGCGDPASREDDRVYRHSLDGVPTSLDPAEAATIYSSFVVLNLYDTLYRYAYLARPYEIVPNLADGLPEVSNDGLTWTFRIRPGARFVDDPAFPEGRGRPVTMHDLAYSLKRHFDPAVRSQGSWLWAGRIAGLDEWGANGADYDAPVEGLRVVDDRTLEIRLVEPYPQLLYTLATAFSSLVPREAVEHYGREFGVRPVGSGPFVLETFHGALTRMRRNPHFERPPLDLEAEGYDPALHARYDLEALDGRRYPFVDALEIHFSQENAARWSSFRAGQVDYVMVPNEQIDAVLSSRDPIEVRDEILRDHHAHAGIEAGFVYAGFDMSDPRFGHHPDPERDAANRALRCAIRDAYDWQERNETFYYGIGEIFPGVIPPVVPEFDPDLPDASVRRDLAAGRARLARYGWTAETLPELTYGLVAGVQQRQMWTQFRSRLVELGFPPDRLDVDNFAAFGDFNRAMKNRQLDLFFLGWSLDYPDAQNTLQLFYGPFETPGSNNFNYRNPAFDSLYERTRAMQPGPERTALYRQMNKMVIDDCVAISGLSRTRVHLWDRDVRMLPDREILGGHFLRFVDVERGGGD